MTSRTACYERRSEIKLRFKLSGVHFREPTMTSSSVNPPDPVNPDPATLKEQWRYAIRMYSKYYSYAWGSAILAGAGLYGLGWVLKGGNPLFSKVEKQKTEDSS